MIPIKEIKALLQGHIETWFIVIIRVNITATIPLSQQVTKFCSGFFFWEISVSVFSLKYMYRNIRNKLWVFFFNLN